MNQILNPSVTALAEAVCEQQRENGFATSALDTTLRYAKHLSSFMESNSLQIYGEEVGVSFLERQGSQFSLTTQGNLRLFISRMNAVLLGENFVTHVKMSNPIVLPTPLANLLTHYKEHCSTKGLHSPTIQNYESRCRLFLSVLASIGISDSRNITAGTISKACLQQPNSSDFPTIRTFFKFLFASGCHHRRGHRIAVSRRYTICASHRLGNIRAAKLGQRVSIAQHRHHPHPSRAAPRGNNHPGSPGARPHGHNCRQWPGPDWGRGLRAVDQHKGVVAHAAQLQGVGKLSCMVSIRCAVSIYHPLAVKTNLTVEDLYGQDFMLIRRGWNSYLDTMQDDLWQLHPQVTVVDFDFSAWTHFITVRTAGASS